jgi:hypothetical protein
MTLNEIRCRYSEEITALRRGDNIDYNELFAALYEYYCNNGEMPYGTAKARDGDPYEWIADRLDRDLCN